MADLRRDAIERGGEHAEHGQKHGVPVSGDDLGCDRFGDQPQPAQGVGLDFRAEVGIGPHRPGDLGVPHLLTRRFQPGCGCGAPVACRKSSSRQ